MLPYVENIQFQARMDKTIDTLLKEVYAAANDGHDAMSKAYATMSEELADTMLKIQQSTTVINDFIPYLSDLQTLKDQIPHLREIRDQITKHQHATGDLRSVQSQPPTPSANRRATGPPTNPPIAPRWINFRARTEAQAQAHIDPAPGPKDSAAPISHTTTHPDQRPNASTNYCPPCNTATMKQPVSSGINEHQVPTTNKPIPHTVHLTTAGDQQGHGLPPVHHDAAIKRAKIQFTGLGELFVFYNQLLNGMQQFGIYLSPLDNVRYQESVCHAEYNSCPITPHRYRQMASTLYQKLRNPDVIPHEHTAIRHIINRYAEQNDGYKILYSMLELIHPVLHQDAVLLPPKSTECNEDIHLYAQKFDSWLKYEAYANRPYSPRETVNLFLRELSPHFTQAVSRIRRLMDTWNQNDPNVPEPLCLSSLPVTIERYMNEEANTPYIRRLHHSQSPRKGSRLPPASDNKNRDIRPSKDKMCRLCGGYGHDDEHCDFTAKWMNVQDASKKVDARLKEKLKDKYKQEQQKHRNRKLKKKVGIIHQMLDDGMHPDEVDDALAALPGLMDSQEDLSDTDSEPSEDANDQGDHA